MINIFIALLFIIIWSFVISEREARKELTAIKVKLASEIKKLNDLAKKMEGKNVN